MSRRRLNLATPCCSLVLLLRPDINEPRRVPRQPVTHARKRSVKISFIRRRRLMTIRRSHVRHEDDASTADAPSSPAHSCWVPRPCISTGVKTPLVTRERMNQTPATDMLPRHRPR
uniref:Uncharacterized protein n=1 Tax=Strigamia maritima TaxID=126957 RepID=T1IWP4_STRMM